MKGDTNSCNISGVVKGEVKVTEKDGKKFVKFSIQNRFQLSPKSKVVEGVFNVFGFGEDNVELCQTSLSEGDYVCVTGYVNQKKDEKSGKILVNLLANHIRKEGGKGASKKQEIEEDDLDF